MRQFIVVGHDAPTTAEFSLDDLAGGAGRLDLLCRCVGAALFRSHGLRRDVRVHLVLGDEVTVCFDGAAVRNVHPGERAIAGLVRAALDRREEAVGHVPVESTPGVTLSKRGVEAAVEAAASDGTLVELHEAGTPVVAVEPPADPVFVLSDHREFADEEAALLADRADARLRLGPERIHADHAIAVAHNFLDTDGYSRY